MSIINLQKIDFPPHLKRKLAASNVFFLLFLIFSLIAVINPKWGEQIVVSGFNRGLDIVYAIDVSRSMDVRDIHGQSRLERGLFIAKQTVHSVPGSRIASVIGRSRGYLSVPLTYDTEAAINFFNTLDSSTMTGRSTNLQALIETAIDSFTESSPARKVIVLISDGEAHYGILRNAINQSIRDGVIIITVAVGTDEGMEVPGIQEDPPPISRRDTQSMRIIAERTGGIYIDGNYAEEAISGLRGNLNSLAQDIRLSQDEKPAERQTVPKSRRSFFIVLAVISYCLHKFVLRSRKIQHSFSAFFFAFFTFISLFFFTSCSEGKLRLLEANYLFSRGRYEEAVLSFQRALEYEDASPYAEYGLGVTFHSNDENMIALNYYQNTKKKLIGITSDSEHRELRYRLQYNSGIIYFEEGDFDSAASAFREALKIDPSKIDAKRNLEISLLSIARDIQTEREPEEGFEEMKDIIFQMVREQEEKRWQSSDWMEERFSGPDY